MDWDVGSDLIGDFTWVAAHQAMVVTQRLAQQFERWGLNGYHLAPVEMSQEKGLKRPTRLTKRTKRRVWLPYEGPPLYQLVVDSVVDVDLVISTTHLRTQGCDVCGWHDRVADGVEDWDHVYDPTRNEIVYTHAPRRPGKGIYVESSRLRERQFFQLSNIRTWPLCTEPVKRLVEESAFTNVAFLEWGETFTPKELANVSARDSKNQEERKINGSNTGEQ